ncbi:hypothetical protein ACFSTD_09680 [Novosphingobium colocasiae]|uniref:hypothetical protein n=1 Tax=Novosphingobium colocasiae TaxID=1256513 RepID=UPI001677B135|nr:hypothetical protein [Novosphingobium colocasiae]
MPVHVMKSRNCGKTFAIYPACDCCGRRWNRLFDAFTNGRGWQRLCAGCIDPERGPPTAYTGPYPVTTRRANRAPHLSIVGGAARP